MGSLHSSVVSWLPSLVPLDEALHHVQEAVVLLREPLRLVGQPHLVLRNFMGATIVANWTMSGTNAQST